jgi:hypothetical protein
MAAFGSRGDAASDRNWGAKPTCKVGLDAARNIRKIASSMLNHTT